MIFIKSCFLKLQSSNSRTFYAHLWLYIAIVCKTESSPKLLSALCPEMTSTETETDLSLSLSLSLFLSLSLAGNAARERSITFWYRVIKIGNRCFTSNIVGIKPKFLEVNPTMACIQRQQQQSSSQPTLASRLLCSEHLRLSERTVVVPSRSNGRYGRVPPQFQTKQQRRKKRTSGRDSQVVVFDTF